MPKELYGPRISRLLIQEKDFFIDYDICQGSGLTDPNFLVATGGIEAPHHGLSALYRIGTELQKIADTSGKPVLELIEPTFSGSKRFFGQLFQAEKLSDQWFGDTRYFTRTFFPIRRS